MKRRIDGLIVLFALAALLVVLAALKFGLLPGTRWPLAWFLLVFALAGSYRAITDRLVRRRVRKMKAKPVPWGVRLQPPMWMSLGDAVLVMEVAGALGAVAAAVGFPGVGVGIALTIVGMVGSGMLLGTWSFPSGLTFEKRGLRVHVRQMQFLVPWSAIAGVKRDGPELHQSITLRLFPGANLMGTVEPNTPRARARLDLILRVGGHKDVWLPPWIGGLDGATLSRALRTGLKDRKEMLN